MEILLYLFVLGRAGDELSDSVPDQHIRLRYLGDSLSIHAEITNKDIQ